MGKGTAVVKYPKTPKGGVVRGDGPCPDCGIRAWRWDTNPDADSSPDTFRLVCVGCGSLHEHVQPELELHGDGASWRGTFGTPGAKPEVPEAVLIDPDARLPPKLTRELVRLAREAMAMPWTFEHGQDWSGENWLIGNLGWAQLRGEDGMCIEEGGTVYLTTDHVRASEVCFDARDDAEWIMAARRLIPALARALTIDQGGQAELERKARATTATPMEPAPVYVWPDSPEGFTGIYITDDPSEAKERRYRVEFAFSGEIYAESEAEAQTFADEYRADLAKGGSEP